MTNDAMLCCLAILPELVDKYTVKLKQDPAVAQHPEWLENRFTGYGVVREFTKQGNVVIRDLTSPLQGVIRYGVFDQREVYLAETMAHHIHTDISQVTTPVENVENTYHTGFLWNHTAPAANHVFCGADLFFCDQKDSFFPRMQRDKLMVGTLVVRSLHAMRKVSDNA